ncbi:MAG TPA: hypothetical protein PK598_15085, partial [Thermoanaerobaculia bacterium]|nr:hypothetical protein [Thermoanaerobaculia bacterium]
ILIRRAGVIERSVKWVRRHPALSTIYALLVVITIGAAAWRVAGEPGGSRTLSLPVRNARPDRRPVGVAVSWNGRALGRVTLAGDGWKRLVLPVAGPGVLRLAVSETFRPDRPDDLRRLGIEAGADPP